MAHDPHGDTLWEITPHTKAKHDILRNYLQAWFPTLTSRPWPDSVLYIDGFAGPGEYLGGEPGSPLIALEEANKARLQSPLHMLFVENHIDRHQHLADLVQRWSSQNRAQRHLTLSHSPHDCEHAIRQLIANAEGSFGPALAFLDQFGYGNVPMDLITSILAYDHCEVLTYLEYKNMNRFFSDETKDVTRTAVFGGEEWRDCLPLSGTDRLVCTRDLYVGALRDPKRANAKYVKPFLMSDGSGVPIYWLIFCTNHPLGFKYMKKAMWTVDKTGEFRFSDKDVPNQKSLFETYTDEWLADEIHSQFDGQLVTVQAIEEWVLTETPNYKFANSLRQLEKTERLRVPTPPVNRNKGTFAKYPLLGVEFGDFRSRTARSKTLFD
jgi:three-Cys-motif partner protein